MSAGVVEVPVVPADQGRRIPSLDGLRAVAIGLVLIAHLGGTPGFPLSKYTAQFFGTGNLGVRIFFVLSGFLITGLLLKEIERTNTVSLIDFYRRRTFRIFPAYYAYICVTVLAVALGWTTLRPGDLFHALTYTKNYYPSHGWWFAHTWSLSVEEQFYLLWPAVLLRLGATRGLRVALVFVCVAPAIRLAEWTWFHANALYSFEAVGDAIAVGCLLSGYRNQLWQMRWYRALLKPHWIAAIAAVVLVVAGQDRPRMQAVVGMTAMNLGVGVIIDYFARMPSGVVGRFLNAEPIRRIGVLSYSIYLWQQPFLNAAQPSWYTVFPLSLVLIAGCALVSYNLIELPFLAAREWIEARREQAVT